MLANRILITESLPSKGLADNDLVRFVQPLVFAESLPTQKRNPKSGEVSGIGLAYDCILAFPQREGRMLGNRKTAVATVALPRNPPYKSGLNAGQGTNVIQQHIEETCALHRLAILHAGEAETHCEYVIGDAAKIGSAQL